MNTSIECESLINIQIDDLLNKLLRGEVQFLSDQARAILIENRQIVIRHLNTLFSYEMPRLIEQEQCQERISLVWGFKLAGLLEASELSEWVHRLCYLPIEDLDESFGDYFVTEELAYLLADTMSQWGLLKNIIENSDCDEYIRSACLNALIFAVVKGRIERVEIIDYFKILFDRILNEKIDDESLCTHIVFSCTNFWPGECLEEIRESFGLMLVDERYGSIDYVLKKFSSGKETCIENLKQKTNHYSYWEELSDAPESVDDDQMESLSQFLKLRDQANIAANETVKIPERNERCNCGSGQKYKKCCINKALLAGFLSRMKLEESTITYGSIESSDSFSQLPEAEKESILDLFHLIEEDPEEVLQTASIYIEKYPDIPILYNFLYLAYRQLNRCREAVKLVKEIARIFPDYLFGRLEYALYLIRRGECEKAYGTLGNAETLSQLYPERKFFHHSEWKAFCYALGLYWVQKGDVNQAKIYLGIINKIPSAEFEKNDLQKKISNKIFHQLIDSRTSL